MYEYREESRTVKTLFFEQKAVLCKGLHAYVEHEAMSHHTGSGEFRMSITSAIPHCCWMSPEAGATNWQEKLFQSSTAGLQ